MNEEESMETLVLGAVRPPPESCDDRGKRPKQETESESVDEEQSEKESEEESSDSEPEEEWVRQMKLKLEWDWKSHTLEEVKEMYENEPYPYFVACTRFVFKNRLQREQEEAHQKALAQYLHMSRGISVSLNLIRESLIASSDSDPPITVAGIHSLFICIHFDN
jgi:hypothetical protein